MAGIASCLCDCDCAIRSWAVDTLRVHRGDRSVVHCSCLATKPLGAGHALATRLRTQFAAKPAV
eukprot:3902761-Alexandrium_andersonii.AAC.1